MAFSNNSVSVLTPFANPGANVSDTFNSFTAGIDAASKVMTDSINAASLNPNDPTNLIRMQAAMANYNMSLMVTSSLVKSVEETAKSITQKL